MTRRIVLAGVLILNLLALPAMAKQEGPGCGLGSMAFEGKSGLLPHLGAFTTNVILWPVGMGAITSGTSGCNADSVVDASKEQQLFVAANLDNLSQEMAQGQGEHLMSLAGLMGCPTAVAGDFGKMSQAKYGHIFTSADAEPLVVLASLKAEMTREPALAASCNRIS